MLKEKDEVIIANPIEGHEKFKNQVGIIIEICYRWFRKTKYRILFKNLEMQKYNKIGLFEFYKEELKKM